MCSFVTSAAFSIPAGWWKREEFSFLLLITPGGIFKLRSHNLEPEDVNGDINTLNQIRSHYKSR